MKLNASRKTEQAESWPRKIQPGRAVVTVYRRKTPTGNLAFMVANYADGKRRFDSYAAEAEALDAADRLAKQIDKRDYVAASMTQGQAVEYADAVAALAPFNVTVRAAASAVAEWLKVTGDLSNAHAAIKFYAARNKLTVKKPVADVVAELLEIKKGRGASERYIGDLEGRLERFADDCRKDACNVTTSDVQSWLDGLKLSSQSYSNFRRVLHLLFQFAVARGYAADNPVTGTEKIKIRNGEIGIFRPDEIARLLDAADKDFRPCLALGAFAGLRTAEIERLAWEDIDLAGRMIKIGASKSKTASRRIVPVHDNLAAWLSTYAERRGKIWTGDSMTFTNRERQTAAATADAEAKLKPVKWQRNGLRHSYASYRFAQIGDAGRVAGELGNSAAVVHKHYRELVKPGDAQRWFAVKPENQANVVAMAATGNA
jgi:integrase